MARVTREHIEARRRQILAAAVRQFGLKGLEPGAATIDDVAADAGLSKGSIYSYFKSKDELLAAIVDSRIEGDIVAFEAAKKRSTSSWEAFWEFSRQVWDSLLDPSTKETILLSIDRMLAEVRRGDPDTRAVEMPINALTELIAGAQKEGRIAADIDSRVLATALWNCQQGTRTYVLRTGDTSTADAVLLLVLDLLLRTAATKPSSAVADAVPIGRRSSAAGEERRRAGKAGTG
jgi:AcrR family transcriptional regulator